MTLIRKNIVHHPVRNGALIFCFIIISASLFSGNYILDGVTSSVKSGIAKLGADVIVVPKDHVAKSEAVLLRGEPSMFFFENDITDRIEAIEGVSRVSPQLYITTVNGSMSAAPVQLIGIDPLRDFTITPWLQQQNRETLQKDEILIGSQIESDIGTTLTFYGHPFTVSGKLDPTGTGVDTSVFMRTEDAYTMADESHSRSSTPLTLQRDRTSSVLVRVENASRAQEISFRIVEKVWGVQVITPEVLISTVSGQLQSLTRILYLTTIVATGLSLPLMALISVMAANERVREIGVLRALGATRGLIFRLAFGESIIIASIGGIIGIFLSWVFLVALQDYIGALIRVPLISPDPGTLIIIACSSLVLTVIVGGLASLYPAYRSAVIDPYTAIRSGEL